MITTMIKTTIAITTMVFYLITHVYYTFYTEETISKKIQFNPVSFVVWVYNP